MDKMYKDNSNTGKCQFKPIESDFKREIEAEVTQHCTLMVCHFDLNDSPCDYWTKDSFH